MSTWEVESRTCSKEKAEKTNGWNFVQKNKNMDVVLWVDYTEKLVLQGV